MFYLSVNNDFSSLRINDFSLSEALLDFKCLIIDLDLDYRNMEAVVLLYWFEIVFLIFISSKDWLSFPMVLILGWFLWAWWILEVKEVYCLVNVIYYRNFCINFLLLNFSSLTLILLDLSSHSICSIISNNTSSKGSSSSNKLLTVFKLSTYVSE